MGKSMRADQDQDARRNCQARTKNRSFVFTATIVTCVVLFSIIHTDCVRGNPPHESEDVSGNPPHESEVAIKLCRSILADRGILARLPLEHVEFCISLH